MASYSKRCEKPGVTHIYEDLCVKKIYGILYDTQFPNWIEKSFKSEINLRSEIDSCQVPISGRVIRKQK